MNKGSKINSWLTLDYICREPENKHFDCKSSSIDASGLAKHISAFANAEGGTLVIGVSDKMRKIEGVSGIGDAKVNDFLNAPKDYCKPMPSFQPEFLDVVNEKGDADRLLLLHIDSSVDNVIYTNKEAWVRFGDKSKEMRGENLRSLYKR